MFCALVIVVYHLKNEHFICEKKDVIKCVISSDCNREFLTFSGLRRHVVCCKYRSSMTNDNSKNCSSNVVSQFCSEQTTVDDVASSSNLVQSVPVISEKTTNIQRNISDLIKDFSNEITASNLSESNVNKILKSTLNLYKKNFELFENIVNDIDDDNNTIKNSFLFECCSNFHSEIITEFNSVLTSYKRKQHNLSEVTFVEPKSKCIGGR